MRKWKTKPPTKVIPSLIRKTGESESLEQLFAFLDKNEPETVRWLVWIFNQQEHSITYAQLEAAYLNGDLPESFLKQWQEKYATYVTETLVPVWEKAMTSIVFADSISALPGTYMPSKFLFEDYLKTQSGKLITNLSTGQASAVQAMLSQLLGEKNMSSVEAARFLRPLIGLTNPQMKANKNFYDATLTGLLQNGKSFSEAHAIATKQATAYAGRQQRSRAVTIARTELAHAYNQAHHLATQEAIDLGLVDDMVKIVCTAANERMCQSCGKMEGEVVLFKERFSNGFMTPPFHPNCRCTVLYRERWLHEQFGGTLSKPQGTGSAPSSSNKPLTGTNGSGTMSESRNGLRIAGALDSYSSKATKHAKKYYESVRAMSTDCKKIAENTSFSIEFVQKVKNHLFMTKHDLGGSSLEYFYPDYDIAQSWQRLMLSVEAIKPEDLLLLQHEFLEQHYMSLGMTQREAHEKANLTYNYQLALIERDEQ